MTTRDTDVWPDNPKEAAVWVLFGLVVTVLLVWNTHPSWLAPRDTPDATAPGTDRVREADDGELRLAVNDRDVLDRSFRGEDEEFVVCGGVWNATLHPRFVTMKDRSRRSATFDPADCGTGGPAGMEISVLHSHPSGAVGLSTEDRELLREGGFSYVCVMSGEIGAGPGEYATDLRCYEQDGADGIREIPVRIVE